MTNSLSAQMLSARVPADLYDWFAGLQVEDAQTNSDKLRVLLASLRRQHEGRFDYASALSWAGDVLLPARKSLWNIESSEGVYSEVVSLLLEHIAALTAIALSTRPVDAASAAKFEDALVQRTAAMFESLLRQATTPSASAFDPAVVRRHCQRCVELLRLVDTSTKGNGNG